MFLFSFLRKIFNRNASSRRNIVMQLSEQGSDFLKKIEELRLTPYDDQTGAPLERWNKHATIGYGHLIPAYEWRSMKGGIDLTMADLMFGSDIKIYERAVIDGLDGKPVLQNEYDALVMLCYNIGINGFKRSSVLKLIHNKKAVYKNITDAWKAWNQSDGKVSQGLINRRQSELGIYYFNEYELW